MENAPYDPLLSVTSSVCAHLQAQAQADRDWHPAPHWDEWGSKQAPAPGKAAGEAGP